MTVNCVGCGAEVPVEDGPVHDYMTASPGCWRLYCDVIAAGIVWRVNAGITQLRTDAYAAQHATNTDPRNRRSVVCHLMSLCAALDLGVAPGTTTTLLGLWSARADDFPDMTAPPPHGEITVADVHVASDADHYGVLVWAWARSVWSAYEPVHAIVRSLVREETASLVDEDMLRAAAYLPQE